MFLLFALASGSGPLLRGASIAPLLNGAVLPEHGTITASGSHLATLEIAVPLRDVSNALGAYTAPALHLSIDARFHHRIPLAAAVAANTSHVAVTAMEVMRGSHSLLLELRAEADAVLLCNHSVMLDIVPPQLDKRERSSRSAAVHRVTHPMLNLGKHTDSQSPLRLAVVDSFGTVQVDGQRQLFAQQCAHLSDTFEVEYLFLSQDRSVLLWSPGARAVLLAARVAMLAAHYLCRTPE